VSLKVLYRALLRLCGFARLERAQIAAPACFCVFLARVQAILAGFQLTNHKHAPRKAVWAFPRRWGNAALGRGLSESPREPGDPFLAAYVLKPEAY
jgi:hypothetical protein